MSSVVSAPTFIIGYNVNPNFVGMYELKRSINKKKMEKELAELKKMSAKKRAVIFDCTEIQAENVTIKLISIYPPKRRPIIVDEKRSVTKSHFSDDAREEDEYDIDDAQDEKPARQVELELEKTEKEKEEDMDECLNCEKSMYLDKEKIQRIAKGSFCCDFCRKEYKAKV